MGIIQGPPEPKPVTIDEAPRKVLVEPCGACVTPNQCLNTDQCIVEHAVTTAMHHKLTRQAQTVSWEVYATIGANDAPRVKHNGQELSGVNSVTVETTPECAVLTIKVHLPSDAIIRIKGARHDWRKETK